MQSWARFDHEDEKRREKLTRAMKLARVLRLAQVGLLGPEERDV